jgi:hypothetical protein
VVQQTTTTKKEKKRIVGLFVYPIQTLAVLLLLLLLLLSLLLLALSQNAMYHAVIRHPERVKQVQHTIKHVSVREMEGG